LVIFLRFGTLSDDSSTWNSATEVFKRTGVKLQTQYNFIRRWRERGFLIFNKKRPGKKEMLSEEQISWLIDCKTLNSMAHLNLMQRS
jgi:transposase